MIIIADIHLGKTNDSFYIDGVPSQTLDIQKRLATVLARAKMTDQSIVIAGDVFNRVNPTTQSISEFFGWLSHCKQGKVNVYIIGGNHDAGADWSSMQMFEKAALPNVTVITSPDMIYVEEPCSAPTSGAVLFWPHMPATWREKAEQGHGNVSRFVASQYKTAEFIITHGTITKKEGRYENDIFFEAGESMEIDLGEFDNVQLAVLGHIHDHKYAGPDWMYPGSLTINNFGEVDEQKGWVEVDLDSLGYEWYAFPDDVTPWVHVELDLTDKDETTLDEEQIEELVKGAVIKITVLAKAHGVINEAYIRQMFNKYGYVSRFETKVTGDVTTITAAKRMSHKQLLTEFLANTDASDADQKRALKMGAKIIEEVRA